MFSIVAQKLSPWGRPAWGALAAALFGAGLAVVLTQGAGGWQLAAFALAPDLPLLAGGGRGLARGQLRRRAVPAYNALHRLSGPAALALVLLAGLGAGWLVAALAWSAHIALDRSLGYGLRTRDGLQRA